MAHIVKFEIRDEFLNNDGEEIELDGIDVGLIDIYSDECEECEGAGTNVDGNECEECEGTGECDEYISCEGDAQGVPIRVYDQSEGGYTCGNYDYYIVTDIPFDYDIDGINNWRDIKHFDSYEEASVWIENIPTITYSDAVEKGWIVTHDNECEDCGNDLDECECEDDGEYKKYHSNGQIKAHYHIKNLYKTGESKEWYENGQLKEFNIETDLLRQHEAWRKDGEASVFRSKKRVNVKEEFQEEFEKAFYKSWHDNGQLKFMSNNKGIFKWYPDGSKQMEDLYSDDYKGFEHPVLVLRDGKKYLYQSKQYISRKSWDESGKLYPVKFNNPKMEDSYEECNEKTVRLKYGAQPFDLRKDITAINVKSNIEYKISSDLRITDLNKGSYILKITNDYEEAISHRKLIVE